VLRQVAGVRGLAELDVLDPAEAEQVASEVRGLRARWRKRSPRFDFYTLGGNAYMDLAGATDTQSSYYAPAQEANTLLEQHFHACYKRLAERLGAALGLAARYPGDLARPGFHIWMGASIPHSRQASVHFDLQYLGILKRPHYAGCTGTVSFTVPVQLPANGSGLNVWPGCTYPAPAAEVEAARRSAPTVIGYRAGTAVVHTGHVLHQIGVTDSPGADDIRMTLQGHGLVRGDELILYW
jgi:hypothetical protein